MKIELEKQKLPDDVNTLKEYSIKIGIELNESNKKILFLEEQINLLNQKIFGRKSEKTEKKDLCPDLFNPVENLNTQENENRRKNNFNKRTSEKSRRKKRD